ncbi:hypothetical protein [Leucobacter aridicollis]|uniref:Uracil DNA glycosylase superfamily protein n=1 Tax=Leucobacter aridicollis TaxID=283878 RepID=A0A852R6C5_9MICO|nr:hypothetical protein [Leucobacter aridicollis]MBL3681920.1 hypothetical protein [Leucobacter aridicollis]NYD27035.1 hypothetical protein [Leucobacter aridicollis]
MPTLSIPFSIYQGLRDLSLTHPEYANLWRMGQIASWSRWGVTTQELAPITADNEADFTALEPFSTGVVFFGINMGGTDIPSTIPDWANFHNHGPDTTLSKSFAESLRRFSTPIPAFYMTDVFKLVATPNAQDLESKIKSDMEVGVDHVARCAEILKEELRLCLAGTGGQPPVLVGMGKAAHDWLTGAHRSRDRRIADAVDLVLGDGAHQRVIRMHHYANGQGSTVLRADKIEEAITRALHAQ